MEIKLQPPRDWDAEVTKGANGELSIRPRFSRADGRQEILFLTIIGDNGAERRVSVSVSARDGDCHINRYKDSGVTPAFDKQQVEKEGEGK